MTNNNDNDSTERYTIEDNDEASEESFSEKLFGRSAQNEDVAARGKDIGEEVGRSIAAIPLFIITTIIGIFGGIGRGILGKLPKRTGVYRKMIKLGYQGMYKKTDAHMVANTIYGDGEMIARPAQLDSDTQTVETSNGEEWTVENGIHPVRIGDTPVVTGGADDHELYDHIAARVAEAVDASTKNYQEVKQTPQGHKPVDTQASRQQAVADGSGVLTEPSNTFDDIWVDISNPNEDNDGMIISMAKAYDLHWDKAASEEMENQETRGILAAKDPTGANKKALIYVALLLGGIALGLFGPALASQLAPSAGGATGGGGGGIAIMLMPWM